MTDPAADLLHIDALVSAFFSLFSNRGGAKPRVEALRDLFVPTGILTKIGEEPESWSVDAFIESRTRILGGGGLTGFAEEETAHRTDLAGGVAQRVSLYRKSGVLQGTPFATRGVKVIQMIRTPGGWRITSVSWDDERPGFTPPATLDPRAEGCGQ